ncbi:MAG: hypothetical protein ACLQVX_17895 [Limisphaerales bacterium]
MNAPVIDEQSHEGPKAQPRARPRPCGADWDDDFSVKDCLDFLPEPGSESVRDAFRISGFLVRRFNKMPGHHAYDLSIRLVTGPPLTTDAEAQRRVEEILVSAGLSLGKGDVVVCRARGLLRVGFLARLVDIPESAGWFDVPERAV